MKFLAGINHNTPFVFVHDINIMYDINSLQGIALVKANKRNMLKSRNDENITSSPSFQTSLFRISFLFNRTYCKIPFLLLGKGQLGSRMGKSVFKIREDL